MKRGADIQLTKDSGDGHSRDDDDDEPGSGFKLASSDELSKRKIRALPKRMGMAPSAPPPAPSIFGGTLSAGPSATSPPFGTTPSSSSNLFGTPSGGPKPFIFGPSSSTTATQTPQSGSSSSSFSPSTTTSPSAAPTSTATSKMFENILTKTAPAPSSTTSQAATNDPLVNIYKKLRSLNITLSDTVKKSIDGDAFVDLGSIFDKYKTQRSEIQTELDKYKGKEAKPDSSSPASTTTTSAPKPAAPPAPTSFIGFGGKPFTPPLPSVTAPSTTTTKALFPEFKPPSATNMSTFPEFKPPSSSNTTSSGFEFKPSSFSAGTFGSKPLETEKEKDKPTTSAESTAAPTNSFFGTSSKSGFAFGASTSTSTLSFGSSSTATSSNFFAPPAGIPKTTGEMTAAPSSFFSLTTPKPTDSSSPAPSSIFGGSPFGKPSTTTADSSSSTPPNIFGGSAFGKPSTTSFFGSAPGTTSASATSSSSSTPLFGSSKSQLQPAFQFGAPSTEAKPPTPAAGSSSTAAEGSSSARSTPATDATTEGGEPGEEGALGLNTPNPHDLEGQGEEDEETVHSVKLKAYRLKKDETGASKWAEIGLGFLRLKKHKETGDRRVLLRNSANGRILLNFRLYAGLSPTVLGTKKGLTFIGHDEGKSTSYLVRLPNEEVTTQLKNALDREIEFVKAKSSDS